MQVHIKSDCGRGKSDTEKYFLFLFKDLSDNPLLWMRAGWP